MTGTYHKLYLAAVEAYPEKPKKTVQIETTALWKEIKEKNKNYNEEIKRLQIKATRTKSSILNFWTTRPKPAPKDSDPDVVIVSANVPSTAAVPEETPQADRIETPDHHDDTKSPAEILIKEKVSETEKKIANFHIVQKTVGLSDEHKKELKTLIDLKLLSEKKLKKLQSDQKSQKKKRLKKRKAIDELVRCYPEAAKKLKTNG